MKEILSAGSTQDRMAGPRAWTGRDRPMRGHPEAAAAAAARRKPASPSAVSWEQRVESSLVSSRSFFWLQSRTWTPVWDDRGPLWPGPDPKKRTWLRLCGPATTKLPLGRPQTSSTSGLARAGDLLRFCWRRPTQSSKTFHGVVSRSGQKGHVPSRSWQSAPKDFSPELRDRFPLECVWTW